MLESKDHYQTQVFSGVLDLTFALRIPGYRVANVKSTPLANAGAREMFQTYATFRKFWLRQYDGDDVASNGQSGRCDRRRRGQLSDPKRSSRLSGLPPCDTFTRLAWPAPPPSNRGSIAHTG